MQKLNGKNKGKQTNNNKNKRTKNIERMKPYVAQKDTGNEQVC